MVFQDTGQRQPKTSVPERQDRNEVSPNGLCLLSGGLPWQRPGVKLRRAQNDKGSYSPQAWEPRREPYAEGPQSGGRSFSRILQHSSVCEGDGCRGLGKAILRHQRNVSDMPQAGNGACSHGTEWRPPDSQVGQSPQKGLPPYWNDQPYAKRCPRSASQILKAEPKR